MQLIQTSVIHGLRCLKKRGSHGPDGQNDLYPFWISPDGDAKIERYVPRLPHSREVLQQMHLQRSLVLYRMVFGQHRQEDLITYLRQRFSDEQIAELVDVCRIDLSPPASSPVQLISDPS